MQAGDTMQDRLHAACTGAFLRKSGFLLRSTSCRSARQLSPWTCASTEAAIALGDAQRLLENFDREQLRVAKEGFGGTREGFGGGTSAAKWAVAYPDWPALRKAVLALTDVSEQVFFDMLMKPRLWFHFGGSKGDHCVVVSGFFFHLTLTKLTRRLASQISSEERPI
jgi:hypothetical protein